MGEPEGTKMSIDFVGGNDAPSITICPSGSYRYNKTLLKLCNMQTNFKNNFLRSQWNNPDIKGCENPKELFEKLYTKLGDIVSQIRVSLHNGTSGIKVEPNQTEYWTIQDTIYKGRCYVFKPNDEWLKIGMREVKIKYIDEINVFIHAKNVFASTKMGQQNDYPLTNGTKSALQGEQRICERS